MSEQSNSNTDSIYSNIFKNNHSIEDLEKAFYELSGMNLKDFLYEKHIKEGLPPTKIAPLFGCSVSSIYLKLKHYGFNRSCRDASIAKEKKEHRKGIYTKTPLQIELETGRKFEDIVNEYMNLGLAPSEIAKKLKLTNQTHIRKILKENEYKQIEILYPNIFKNGRKLYECEELFFKLTGMNLKEFLHQKYVEEGLSTYEIAAMFGCVNKVIHQKLKKYGFSRNLSEARKVLMKNGKINYTEIGNKSRSTSKKTYTHSNNQNLAREILKEKFENIFLSPETDGLELVTGYQEWCILRDKEVDIPIIIIDKTIEKFHKISIEYNGKHWHDEERDFKKKSLLTDSDWNYNLVLDNLSYAKIEEQIESVCNDIISFALDYRNYYQVNRRISRIKLKNYNEILYKRFFKRSC